MALDATGRARAFNQWMRENQIVMPGNVTKPVGRQAMVAMDTWMENNWPSLLAALPVEFRPPNVPVEAVADMFTYMMRRRTNKLRAEEDGPG